MRLAVLLSLLACPAPKAPETPDTDEPTLADSDGDTPLDTDPTEGPVQFTWVYRGPESWPSSVCNQTGLTPGVCPDGFSCREVLDSARDDRVAQCVYDGVGDAVVALDLAQAPPSGVEVLARFTAPEGWPESARGTMTLVHRETTQVRRFELPTDPSGELPMELALGLWDVHLVAMGGGFPEPAGRAELQVGGPGEFTVDAEGVGVVVQPRLIIDGDEDHGQAGDFTVRIGDTILPRGVDGALEPVEVAVGTHPLHVTLRSDCVGPGCLPDVPLAPLGTIEVPAAGGGLDVELDLIDVEGVVRLDGAPWHGDRGMVTLVVPAPHVGGGTGDRYSGLVDADGSYSVQVWAGASYDVEVSGWAPGQQGVVVAGVDVVPTGSMDLDLPAGRAIEGVLRVDGVELVDAGQGAVIQLVDGMASAMLNLPPEGPARFSGTVLDLPGSFVVEVHPLHGATELVASNTPPDATMDFDVTLPVDVPVELPVDGSLAPALPARGPSWLEFRPLQNGQPRPLGAFVVFDGPEVLEGSVRLVPGRYDVAVVRGVQVPEISRTYRDVEVVAGEPLVLPMELGEIEVVLTVDGVPVPDGTRVRGTEWQTTVDGRASVTVARGAYSEVLVECAPEPCPDRDEAGVRWLMSGFQLP